MTTTPPESTGASVPDARRAPRALAPPGALRTWLGRHVYLIAGFAVFVSIAVCCWTSFIEHDEEVYFLGARRLADPTFLARDLTWERLPPTSALFDHLVAPLWKFTDEVTIYTFGRLVFWVLMAWSIAFLARAARLPPWSAAVGFTCWLLWRQTLGMCGSPLEGFQVKSLAYPMIFFALGFAIRGQPVRAGLAAGLGTAFHIVIGGWGFLGLLAALSLVALFERTRAALRQVVAYGLAAAVFIGPLVLFVIRFTGAHVSAAEQALMDRIYVTFAMPHCTELFYFMKPPITWAPLVVVFVLAPPIVFAWRDRRAAWIVGGFVTALILVHLGGVVAARFNAYGLLKLYPFQLANALPAMFLFVFVFASLGTREVVRRLRWPVYAATLIGSLWLLLWRDVPSSAMDAPKYFLAELHGVMVETGNLDDPLFTWVRTQTPKNSVFISPLILAFWPYAERAQVASMRHPPLDRRILEWERRLVELNGGRPYLNKEFETGPELAVNEARLTVPELIRMRERYGATHYLIKGRRYDLNDYLVYEDATYTIYDVMKMVAPADSTSAAPPDSVPRKVR